jgi:hypothetical protein
MGPVDDKAKQGNATAARCLALPLCLRGGAFETTDMADSLLRFSRCFFAEHAGSRSDDPGFGGLGVPWGKSGSLLLPLEPVVAEFRNRYGASLDARVAIAEVDTERGKRRVRIVRVGLRESPGVFIHIEV